MLFLYHPKFLPELLLILDINWNFSISFMALTLTLGYFFLGDFFKTTFPFTNSLFL